MKFRRVKRWASITVILMVIGFMGFGAVFTAPQASNQLTSVKVAKAPTLDGAVDDLWNQAQALQIPVFGGANNGSTTVDIKSVYTNDSIYFLVQWADPTESLRRFPWQKQADGTWKQLIANNQGDDNVYYEDKLAFIWNIDNSIVGFNEGAGCFALCHAGEPGKPYGNKYTASPAEIGDIWHWKSVRTGPVSQVDDQYVDSTRYDPTTAPEAGRKSDPRFLGGYRDNVNADKTKPAFTFDDQPAPPYWIYDVTKQPFADTYAPDDEVAGIVVAPFLGDRGDIACKGVWANGVWTLEIARTLVTGSQYDVQFSDLTKGYFFGMSAFDNAQVRHAFQTGVNELRFAQ
ncbi:MAG: ethylbenzene dehydrogenase [Acidobacteria bacterium]|nr:ethylbenzene dehydrogenase [Acidobacteriota bacterium]